MNKLRVGFLCALDPTSPYAFSGSLQRMRLALEATDIELSLIGLDAVRPGRLQQKIGQVRQRINPGWRPGPARERRQQRLIARDMRQHRPQVVFAPIASTLLKRWEHDTPVVYCSDATPKLMEGYYTPYEPATDAAGPGLPDDEGAVRRAAAAVYSSRWAADSAVNDYGIDPAAVHIVPLGANFSGGRELVELERREIAAPLRLLFISKYWVRKGGDLAVAAAGILRERGLPVELHIVGSDPPVQLPDWVSFEGFLAKDQPKQAERMRFLLQNCQLFILPTRADCTPVVLNEAHAYGMPAVSTDTGGVSSVVEDGVTATLLPVEAPAKAWADAVAELWADPDRLRAMSIAARRRYEDCLTWEAWARGVLRIMRQVVEADGQAVS
jgi:glycosyltransferase involved in cell wall biosynthesis